VSATSLLNMLSGSCRSLEGLSNSTTCAAAATAAAAIGASDRAMHVLRVLCSRRPHARAPAPAPWPGSCR
jgi:hypothetical protein